MTTTTEKKRRRRRETLREITEHARGALEYRNATTTTTARVEEKTKKNAARPGWTNADWQRAFDALFLDDAESFKEVGMQDDLLFYAPRFSSGSAEEEEDNNNNNNNNESNGAKDVVFVRRWKKKDTKSDDGAASEKKTSDTRTKMDLTTETVDWRATTLLNIVQHTTYSAEVSVCLLDELERKSNNSSKTEQQQRQRQRGTLSNPLASCKIKVFASTSKMTHSNKLKSDRRESTLPEVAFDSYYANSEEWEKCALTKDGDCLCVRLFATGGVLKFHDDEDTESNVDTENDDVGKKIIVFSGFAPRTDVARAYNVERKATYKQAFTFRAFANSTFGFDLPKLHNNNIRRMNNGSNNITNSYGVVAENGLYDDRYQANCGTHGSHSDDDDDNNNVEANHLDGDIPDTSNHDDDDDGNHGNSGGGGGGRKYDFSPDRHHPKSFASPSRGGAGETDAVVTLGRGTEEEGEAVVAVSAERLHFSPLSSTKRGRDDFSASGGSRVNSDDNSSAYDTDDSPSSSNLSGTPSQKKNNNRKGGVRRLLNFGRKVETVTEIVESSSLSSPRNASHESDVTRLRCRLLSVKVHWRALARDLLYKEWR